MSMRMERRVTWALGVVVAMLITGLWIFAGPAPRENPVERAYTDFQWVRRETVSVTATGDPGAATGSNDTDRRVHGRVYAVHVDYTAGISSTTDITLTQANPSLTVLALTDNATDGWYYPTVAVHDTTGGSRQWYKTIPVADHIDIAAGETTSGTVATVTVYWGQ